MVAVAGVSLKIDVQVKLLRVGFFRAIVLLVQPTILVYVVITDIARAVLVQITLPSVRHQRAIVRAVVYAVVVVVHVA